MNNYFTFETYINRAFFLILILEIKSKVAKNFFDNFLKILAILIYLLNNVESWMEDILFDPQTSGGLLISCKEKDYIDILTRLEKLEVESAVIGRVEDFNDAYIVVE